jgi:hypothetical protein
VRKIEVFEAIGRLPLGARDERHRDEGSDRDDEGYNRS